MLTDEIKQKTRKETGCPEHLLTGETEEEARARALAIRAFVRDYREEHKDEFSPETPKTNAQLFAEFFDQQMKHDVFSDPNGFLRIFGG